MFLKISFNHPDGLNRRLSRIISYHPDVHMRRLSYSATQPSWWFKLSFTIGLNSLIMVWLKLNNNLGGLECHLS